MLEHHGVPPPAALKTMCEVSVGETMVSAGEHGITRISKIGSDSQVHTNSGIFISVIQARAY